MKAIVDTHTLFWAGVAPHMLSRTAAETIADPRNNLLVSAASAWEMATKVRLGRFPEAAGFEGNFFERVKDAGYTLLPITVEDGLRAGRLVGAHQDPFDRMIAAQALADDIVVISIDPKLDIFGVRRIW